MPRPNPPGLSIGLGEGPPIAGINAPIGHAQIKLGLVGPIANVHRKTAALVRDIQAGHCGLVRDIAKEDRADRAVLKEDPVQVVDCVNLLRLDEPDCAGLDRVLGRCINAALVGA
jgi:hypothetical protein